MLAQRKGQLSKQLTLGKGASSVNIRRAFGMDKMGSGSVERVAGFFNRPGRQGREESEEDLCVRCALCVSTFRVSPCKGMEQKGASGVPTTRWQTEWPGARQPSRRLHQRPRGPVSWRPPSGGTRPCCILHAASRFPLRHPCGGLYLIAFFLELGPFLPERAKIAPGMDLLSQSIGRVTPCLHPPTAHRLPWVNQPRSVDGWRDVSFCPGNSQH